MSIALPQAGRASERPNIAAGILWYLLRGNRRRLMVAAVYWIVMAVLSHTLLSDILATYDSLLLSSLAIMSLIPLGGLMLLVIGQFNMTTMFEETFKGYPPHLLRLPATSAALAVWPMVFGIPTVCVAWIVLGKTVLTPLGIPTEAAVPCLGLCAALILCQCVTWAPLNPTPRFLLYFASLGLVGGSAFGIGLHGWNHLPFILAYSTAIILGVPLAIGCVSASRRGEIYTPDYLRPLAERIGDVLRRRPEVDTTDGRRAQAWLDNCMEGAPMPWALIFLALITLPALLSRNTVSLVGPSESNWPIAGIRVLPWAFGVMLAPVVAIILGGLLGNNPLPSAVAFLRPLTSTEIAASKLRAALTGALTTNGVVILLACLALLTPASDGSAHGILGALLLKDLAPANLPPIILVAVLIMLVITRARIDGIWSSVLRNHWLAAIQLIGPACAFVGLMVWNGFGGAVTSFLIDNQTALASILTLLKLGSFIGVVTMLCRRGLVEASTILRQCALWVGVSAGLTVLASMALPSTISLSTTVALAFAAMPAVRIALVPWAVDKARHQ